MFEHGVSRELSVSAEAAWGLLSDWGNTDWLPGPEKTEVINAGDRVTRRLFMPDADPIEETLLSCNHAGMRLHYTIPASELFPLQNYSGNITVSATGMGCRVDWCCTFDLGGMLPEQAEAVAQRNLDFLLDSVVRYLNG